MVAIEAANSALHTLLNGTISSTSSGTGDRFFTDKMPQNVLLPAVRFQVISSVKENVFTPLIANHRNRVQMDGYEATATLRSALRTAIVNAFYGYSGTIGGETVKSILIDNEMEGEELLETNAQVFRTTIDFMVDMA